MLNRNDSAEITDWCLSDRAVRALQAIGVTTLGHLRELTERELLQTPNFGRKHLNEIKEILSSYGAKLGSAPVHANRFRTDFSHLIVGYDAP